MPRINKQQMLFDRCSKVAKDRGLTLVKEFEGFKAGDKVRCVNTKEYDVFNNNTVIGICIRHDRTTPLVLTYTPTLPEADTICWGDKVLSLESKWFEKL